MRRVTTILAAALLVLAAAGPAAAAHHPRRATEFLLCDDKGGGDECAQARFATAGSHVESDPSDGSNLQHWSFSLSSACGGHVTSTCPSGAVFRQWDGAPIEYVRVQAGGLYMVAGSPGVTIAPEGSGDEWIASGFSLINKSETGQLGSGRFLTAGPNQGDVFTTGSWTSGLSQFGADPLAAHHT